MLAQSFLSAAELEITEAQKEALMKTLVLLETGKLVHIPSFKWNGIHSNKFTGHFNMKAWGSETECGTVHCIGGTAEAISGDERLFANWVTGRNEALKDLFTPDRGLCDWPLITDSQAATALRSYLTTGDAKWHEAVA